MATEYKNKANFLSVIGGINVSIDTNEVTSILADNPTATKTQGFSAVVSGSQQTYTATINNTNILPLLAVIFTDIIPAGMSLVTGSFKLNGTVVTPVVVGQTITYTIATVPASGSATIEFKALVA